MVTTTHQVGVQRAYGKILQESPAKGNYIEISSGKKIHVIEAGEGEPFFYLHGGGAAAHTVMPLLKYLHGLRLIAPDRPGYGLSDAVDFGQNCYQDLVLEVLDQIFDAYETSQFSLCGSSGGGVWAIWYALARPERVRRLVLLGSAPLLPGTYAQIPLRIMATPIIGELISSIPTNEKMVVEMMGMMGEKETIVNYPMMIEALSASNNDPLSSKATLQEYAALLNLRGFRENMKIRRNDLTCLEMPTLVIWGEHDPLGGKDVARAVSEAIPNSELALLPAGHVPWLGYPEKTAEFILDFIL